MSVMNYQSKTKPMLMLSGLCGALLLSACASKPTYQQGSSKAVGGSNAPKVVMNNRGVPSHHLVKQGDTVSKIAERYGLNWRDIGRINNLNSQYTIYTGQWLTLWQGNASSNTTAATTPPRQSTTARSQVTATPTPPAVTTTTSTPSYTPPPVTASAPPSVGSAGLMQFRYPVGSGNPVVRRFGTTTINGQAVTSQGMWFSGRAGDAVLASRTGTVLHADGNIDGAMIAIAHTDGFVSNYFHIQNAQVKSGQTVQAGQQIATMRPQADGTALLEFRIARNSSYIDPLSVLK